MGPILTRSGRALLHAGEVADGSARSGGAPLLVVGHSAGGLTARLLTSPEPFAGRRLGAAPRIGAIVTLGTPHRVTPTGLAGRRLADAATDFADRVVPGPAFAPTTGYLAVASRSVVGRRRRRPWRTRRATASTAPSMPTPAPTAGRRRWRPGRRPRPGRVGPAARRRDGSCSTASPTARPAAGRGTAPTRRSTPGGRAPWRSGDAALRARLEVPVV